MRRLDIILPPIILVVVGTAVYIMVVKATTPKPIVVTGSPQTASGTATPVAGSTIKTNVASPSASQIAQWRLEATHSAAWRIDPVSAAKQQSLEYGFDVSDSMNLVQSPKNGVAQVSANHQDAQYTITMQQFGSGPSAVWAISDISKQ